MFERFKPAALIALALWGVIGIFYALTPKAQVRETNMHGRVGQSTYDVWELEIHAAAAGTEKFYRFPIVVDREFEDLKPELTGFLWDVDADRIPVGQTLDLDQDQIRFRPLGGAETTVRGAGPVKLRATLRHVKSCPVKMKESVESRVVNTGSGIIAVPKLKKQTVRSFSEPPCRASEDLFTQPQPSLPAQAPAQANPRQIEIDKQERLRALSMKRQERERAIIAAWKAAASKVDSSLTTSRLKADASAFVREVCKDHVPLMRVLGVQALTADRVLISRTHHDGYDEEIYQSKAALEFKSGPSFDYRTDLGLSLPFMTASIQTDDLQCLKSQPPRVSGGGYEVESKALKDIETILAAYMREAARSIAEREIPSAERAR